MISEILLLRFFALLFLIAISIIVNKFIKRLMLKLSGFESESCDRERKHLSILREASAESGTAVPPLKNKLSISFSTARFLAKFVKISLEKIILFRI